MCKPDCSRSSKTTPLRTRIRPICIPLSSPVSVPQLDSADEQRHWLGLLLGHRRYELRLPRSWAGSCKANPFSITVRFSVLGPTHSIAIRVVRDQSRGSMKWPTMLREAGCPPWVLSLWRNQRLCVVLYCPGEMQLMCSCSSYPSNPVCLGLWGIRGVSAAPLCSRIPLVLSCTWIDISSSCEGEQSQEWPMSPSWWHHSKSSFLNSQHFLLYFLVLIKKNNNLYFSLLW